MRRRYHRARHARRDIPSRRTEASAGRRRGRCHSLPDRPPRRSRARPRRQRRLPSDSLAARPSRPAPIARRRATSWRSPAPSRSACTHRRPRRIPFPGPRRAKRSPRQSLPDASALRRRPRNVPRPHATVHARGAPPGPDPGHHRIGRSLQEERRPAGGEGGLPLLGDRALVERRLVPGVATVARDAGGRIAHPSGRLTPSRSGRPRSRSRRERRRCRWPGTPASSVVPAVVRPIDPSVGRRDDGVARAPCVDRSQVERFGSLAPRARPRWRRHRWCARRSPSSRSPTRCAASTTLRPRSDAVVPLGIGVHCAVRVALAAVVRRSAADPARTAQRSSRGEAAPTHRDPGARLEPCGEWKWAWTGR